MSVTAQFGNKAAAPPAPRARRPPPFCLRLSASERAELVAKAGDAPLGAYIKEKLFDGLPARNRRSGIPLQDKKALAQVLAALGASNLAANVNQLAKLAHVGALPVGEELEAELFEAASTLRQMRSLLMRALGLKPEDAP